MNGRRRGGRERTPGRDLWDALWTASGGRRRGGRKRTPGRVARGGCEGSDASGLLVCHWTPAPGRSARGVCEGGS